MHDLFFLVLNSLSRLLCICQDLRDLGKIKGNVTARSRSTSLHTFTGSCLGQGYVWGSPSQKESVQRLQHGGPPPRREGGPGNSQGVWRGRRIRGLSVFSLQAGKKPILRRQGAGFSLRESCSRKRALRSPSVESRWGLFPQTPWCRLT